MAQANDRKTSGESNSETIVSVDGERFTALVARDDVAVLATAPRDAKRSELVGTVDDAAREVLDLAADDRLVTDGGRTYRDVKGLLGPMDVERPEWASEIAVGDVVPIGTPAGVLEVRVIGFSTLDRWYGAPAAETPYELSDVLDANILVIREEDLVDEDETELATDGGVDDDLEETYELRLRGRKADLVEVASVLYDGMVAKTNAGVMTPPDHQMIHELVTDLNDELDVPSANEAMRVRLGTGDLITGDSIEADLVELEDDDPELATDGGADPLPDSGVAAVDYVCQNFPEHPGEEVKMVSSGPGEGGVVCPECGRMAGGPDDEIPYGDPPHYATDGGRFVSIEGGERVERTEEEILEDLVDRGIARPIPESDHSGNLCRNPSCDEVVPENSHKTLNLGIEDGFCSLLCLLEVEDDPELATDGGVEIAESETAYVLNWGRFGPPHGGTYHPDPGCWCLDRSDSDREPVPLPWPISDLEEDEEWSACGHCTEDDVVEEPSDALSSRLVEERETCSGCEERPAAVGTLCARCHRKAVNGAMTDGGVVERRRSSELGLPDDVLAFLPDRYVSLEAREILEEISFQRVTVERVLEVAYGRRDPDRVSISDLLSVLGHADGRLALLTFGNTGVSVVGRDDGEPPFQRWTYSALDAALGNDPSGVDRVRRSVVKESLRYSTPSIIPVDETPLGSGFRG